MKKLLSLLAVLALLVSMVMPVSAANTVIEPEVLNQVTDGEDPEVGLGVAFLYTMNMNDVAIIGNRTFNGAYVDGVKVIELGAVVSNQEDAANAESMVLENVTGLKMLKVEGKKLWDGWTNTRLQYAVRITNIPEERRKTQIYSRPYYILEGGAVVYGDITNKSYFSGWCDANPVELPAVGTPVDAADAEARVTVSKAEIVDRTVTLSLINNATKWTIGEGSSVTYACYDKNGEVLEETSLQIGSMDAEEEKSFTFDVPDNTALVAFAEANITYKVIVTLPAIGSDIDVTKKKNRIRVSAASIVGETEKNLTVSLTFKNYTTNWITEETDYVKYTAYDINGKAVKSGTIYIGVIDTKKNKEKTFTFDVPATTAQVKLTSSKIVYWTEWA